MMAYDATDGHERADGSLYILSQGQYMYAHSQVSGAKYRVSSPLDWRSLYFLVPHGSGSVGGRELFCSFLRNGVKSPSVNRLDCVCRPSSPHGAAIIFFQNCAYHEDASLSRVLENKFQGGVCWSMVPIV